MSTIYNDEIVEIPFPDRKFKTYLDELNVSSAEELTIFQKQNIFISAIKDFKTGKVALDELAEIAGFLWSTLEDRDTDLADALYECSELNYYIRHIEDLEEKTGTFIWFITDVMKYYTRYKNRVIK